MGTDENNRAGVVIRLSPRSRTGYVVDDVSGCWNWAGFTRPDGYGKAWDARRKRVGRAHRVVYEAARGPLDQALDLDHLCRNRRCVNPAHLEPVSRQVNLARGHGTKLTWDTVREIRARYADGGVTHRSLALEYGISNRTCSAITMGRSWIDPAYVPPSKVSRRPPPFPRD